MYDPDLIQVGTWDVASLKCLEHGTEENPVYDGLKASSGGTKHGILVPIPVSLMEKAGEYKFVLHFKDNHSDKYKDHKVKPALEVNSEEKTPIIDLVASDLFKSTIPMWEEYNPGAFVHFNLDNDDDSDNSDDAKHPGGDYRQRTDTISGENDLKKARVFFPRSRGMVPADGKIVLRVRLASGSNHARVWKSQTKGSGNEVLVGVYEKDWDLSDPVQRQAFEQIKDNLWVEGMEYNSVCWLEVEYKKQVSGQWKVVSWDKVKYTFIAADCVNQPRTDDPHGPFFSTRHRFETWFPNLVRCEWSILGVATDTYNCIAWSVGIWDEWIWWQVDVAGDPQRDGYGNGIIESEDFDAFYDHHGYTPTPNIDEAVIILYRSASAVTKTNPEGITHAAKKRVCACGAGRWIMFESKCGSAERIEHCRDQLNGGTYGSPFRHYKRRSN